MRKAFWMENVKEKPRL